MPQLTIVHRELPQRDYLLVMGEVRGRRTESSPSSNEDQSNSYYLVFSVGAVNCNYRVNVSAKEYRRAGYGSKYFLLIVNRKIVSYFSADQYVPDETLNRDSSV